MTKEMEGKTRILFSNLFSLVLDKKQRTEEVSDLFSFALFPYLKDLPESFFSKSKIKGLLINAYNWYGGRKRKVNKESYFRHPLLVAVFTEIALEKLLKGDGISEEDRLVAWATALFHDALEIKKGEEEELLQFLNLIFSDQTLAQRVIRLVKFLTPEKRGKLTKEDYLKEKRVDFKTVMTADGFDKNDQLILKLVKVNDVFANMKETLIDLNNRKIDGMGRPFEWRLKVFEERVAMIRKVFDNYPFLMEMRLVLTNLKNYSLDS